MDFDREQVTEALKELLLAMAKMVVAVEGENAKDLVASMFDARELSAVTPEENKQVRASLAAWLTDEDRPRKTKERGLSISFDHFKLWLLEFKGKDSRNKASKNDAIEYKEYAKECYRLGKMLTPDEWYGVARRG